MQQLLVAVRGELARRGQEVGLSRSLLQQYHRAVQQLLAALESVRELGGGQQQLLGGVVAASHKLRVANMQLEASRYVLDFCQEALSITQPSGSLSLVASIQHTTTTTTSATTNQATTSAEPASPSVASTMRHIPVTRSSPSPAPATPPVRSADPFTTTTTTTATRLTLSCTPAQLSLSAAQAAWRAYFAAIAVALDDPRQHTLAMLPVLLASLLSSLARNTCQANRAYWTAVLSIPRAMLRSLGATSSPGPPTHPRSAASSVGNLHAAAPAGSGRVLSACRNAGASACVGVADVAVAYLNYTLAMASSGLEIMNTLTSAWCCVIHSAHMYAVKAPAPQRGPPRLVHALVARGGWPARIVSGVVSAKVGAMMAAVWAALGAWHLAVSSCCVLLGTCNMLGSFLAGAVQLCAVGRDSLPRRASADLARSLYLSSARSLALCSLTGMYGCTYLCWAFVALNAAWERVGEAAGLLGAACAGAVEAWALAVWWLLLAGPARLLLAGPAWARCLRDVGAAAGRSLLR